MINLDSILKSRDITLLAKIHLVKAMVFPVVMYGCESCTIKKAECRRRLLRVPWMARNLSSGTWCLTAKNSVRDTLIGSVQFSRSVMSDSLWPDGLQYARPPCPSPTPRVYSNSCPLSQWCHPTISSSVIPFFFHLQSFPASGSFQMSQLFASGAQSIGVSASTSVLPMNTQDWSHLGWTCWISLQSKGLSRVFSNTTVQKQSNVSAI